MCVQRRKGEKRGGRCTSALAHWCLSLRVAVFSFRVCVGGRGRGREGAVTYTRSSGCLAMKVAGRRGAQRNAGYGRCPLKKRVPPTLQKGCGGGKAKTTTKNMYTRRETSHRAHPSETRTHTHTQATNQADRGVKACVDYTRVTSRDGVCAPRKERPVGRGRGGGTARRYGRGTCVMCPCVSGLREKEGGV